VNSETDYWMVLDAIKKIVGESAEQRKAEAAADEASA
jgi:hypothetical protein